MGEYDYYYYYYYYYHCWCRNAYTVDDIELQKNRYRPRSGHIPSLNFQVFQLPDFSTSHPSRRHTLKSNI